MVKYLCIVQARISSSRLPAKVMLDINGKTLINRVYESLLKSKRIDKILFVTSTETTDDILASSIKSMGLDVYRGSLDNVLERFSNAAKKFNAENVIRVTADNPLTDPKLIDYLISVYEEKNVEYCGFNSESIIGITSEVFSSRALFNANSNTKCSFDQEHVTPYIKRQKNSLFIDNFEELKDTQISVTIDTLEDYIKLNKFYIYCKEKNIEANIYTYLDYYENSNFNRI